MIIGVVCFIGSFYFIFSNESRLIESIKTLSECQKLTVAIDSSKIDPLYNNRLVHIYGVAQTNDFLRDPIFGVQENALRLERIVEMYQWKEKRHSRRRSAFSSRYTYDKVWSEEPIDSSKFMYSSGHENPAMPYQTAIYLANNVKVSNFNLAPLFINQINNVTSYTLSPDNFNAMDNRLKKSFKLRNNSYFSGDPDNPQIGAINIRYEIVKPTDISVIGKQNNNTLQAYNIKNSEITLVEIGNKNIESMFTIAEQKNKFQAWFLRIGAFFLMWIGLLIAFYPIAVLCDFVPFIGDILDFASTLVLGLVALALSLVIIAIAWLIYRPLIAATFIVLAGGFFFGGFTSLKDMLQKSKNKNDYRMPYKHQRNLR
jgi:hypothetical protein